MDLLLPAQVAPAHLGSAVNSDRLNQYLSFVEERHRVWELRQLGAPQPWTRDPILAARKFTNVFRVLDPGSQFVFELCPPDLHWRDALYRVFLYRYTNLPAAWEDARTWLGDYPSQAYSPPEVTTAFTQRRDRGKKVFSGAYVILPQPNRPGDKVVQAVELTERWVGEHGDDFISAQTQQERFDILRREYGVGPFMAMQILTDWGYTPQCGEDREHEFVWPGPGALKGAKAISGRAPADLIRFLHGLVQLGDDCPTVAGRTPSLMDIQNTLCEFSKYVRYADRPNSVRPYVPAHPGPQPDPILPAHWQN